MKFIENIGVFLIKLFSNLGKFILFGLFFFKYLFRPKFYLKNNLSYFFNILISSIPIIALTGIFSGMVLALQSYTGFSRFSAESAIPNIVVLTLTRELGPVLTGLMISARVGSSIAAEIATMRVTEQIDALEVMGVNTYNYLIFPKVVAMTIYPFIIVISMFLGIFGGYFACVTGGFTTHTDFIDGLQLDFVPFHLNYAFIKTFLFAMILATIPSYHGFFMKGGALEVGKASTTSFVWTSVAIIIMNSFVTNLLLT